MGTLTNDLIGKDLLYFFIDDKGNGHLLQANIYSGQDAEGKITVYVGRPSPDRPQLMLTEEEVVDILGWKGQYAYETHYPPAYHRWIDQIAAKLTPLAAVPVSETRRESPNSLDGNVISHNRAYFQHGLVVYGAKQREGTWLVLLTWNDQIYYRQLKHVPITRVYFVSLPKNDLDDDSLDVLFE